MNTPAKPPINVDLVWAADLRFAATVGTQALVVDGDGAAGPSPVHLLLVGLAGCMSIDVVDIIKKGRHALAGFRAELTGERVPDPPRRLSRVTMRFRVQGDVPAHAVERAITLSREKYCSVWHSLRQDIDLVTSFDVVP